MRYLALTPLYRLAAMRLNLDIFVMLAVRMSCALSHSKLVRKGTAKPRAKAGVDAKGGILR